MARYETSLILPHRADDLFDLIADIRRYPEFVKWIRAMRVTDERQVDGVRHCLGEAVVGFKGLVEPFATTVRADPAARTIETRLVRGPFRRLNNTWTLSPLADTRTQIGFTIDYEFSNPVLRLLAATQLETAVDRIMRSFLEEADRRYGRAGAARDPN